MRHFVYIFLFLSTFLGHATLWSQTNSDKQFPLFNKHASKALYWLKKIDGEAYTESVEDLARISFLCKKGEQLKNPRSEEELKTVKDKVSLIVREKKKRVNAAFFQDKYKFLISVLVWGDSHEFVAQINREFDQVLTDVEMEEFEMIVQTIDPILLKL